METSGSPIGTVTFLLSDIVGSTQLWEQAPLAMATAMVAHDGVIDEAVSRFGGALIRPRGEGDSRFAVFGRASDAATAAAAIVSGLASVEWATPDPVRVRVGLHTGEVEVRDGDYYGTAVNLCARLRGLAHPGQVLMSETTARLVEAAPSTGLTARDVGRHRLKGLRNPERVFQLCHPDLDDSFPVWLGNEPGSVRSLDDPALPNNLPRYRTPLIGRESELAAVQAMTIRSQLVTLTGSGGAGKTRLAVQVAAELLDGSGDGVWIVEFAPVMDPARVASAVAAVLRVREDPAVPASEVLVVALADRWLLLVLDNCEHLIDAVAKLADALLRGCPGVHLLATSREPLGVDGEHVYRVPSLTVPSFDASVDEIVAAGAVRLFVDRARVHQPGFVADASTATTVARIVRRLDGIPLALELAAARLRSLTVDEVAVRLDHRFQLLTTGNRTTVPRQQTLRAAMDWSYDLLNETERSVLCRTSVFLGGFDLAAAEAIVGDAETANVFGVVDVIDALVDKSLIQHDPTSAPTSRYRLLESIRDYSAEHLAVAGLNVVGDLRRAHLAHYLAVAETARLHLQGPDPAPWLDRLSLDHDNLMAAMATAVELPDATTAGMRLATALHRYWRACGHTTQVIAPLSILCERDAPHPERAGALITLARCYNYIGSLQAAHRLADAALDLALRIGDPHLAADALVARSGAAEQRGDVLDALTDIDQALTYTQAAGDRHLEGRCHHVRGRIFARSGDLDGARREEGLASSCYQAAGDVTGEAGVLTDLADIELVAGDLTAAATLLAACQPIADRVGDLEIRTVVRHNRGMVEALRGDHNVAYHHFVAALQLARQTGDMAWVADSLIGCAHSLAQHNPKQAASIHGAADSLLGRLECHLQAAEARLHSDTRSLLQTRLGAADFQNAYNTGAELPIAEVIALATDRGLDLDL